MIRNALIGFILVGSGWCLGGDWPRWRGPAGTGHVPAGAAVPKTLPSEPKVVWRVKIGRGLASPVVGGGKVFYLDNQEGQETVHAVDAATGKELWRARLDEAFKDYQSAPGPRCAPVVDGPSTTSTSSGQAGSGQAERVYVQSCRGEFRCLAAADGKVVWRKNFVKDFGAVFIGEKGSASGASRHGNSGSAMVDGGRIFVAAGGRDGASVVCLDKLSGKVIWKSQDDIQGYSGPMVATIEGVKQVISFTSVAVIGLDAGDGRLLWRVPVKTRLGRHVITPVVVGNRVLVASHQAGLVGIQVARKGTAFTAERAWVARQLKINFSSPVAVGDFLYGIAPGGSLVCVDVRTGKPAWVEKGFFSGMTRKGYASFVVMGGDLLVLAEKGQLLLVAADPKACRTVGKTQVCGQNWCNPAYAGGRLFLRDDKELLCVELMP